MSTVTLRFAEEKHARLRQLAARQGVSMNKLLDEQTRFQMGAQSGSVAKGLKVLAKLDRHFSKKAG